MSDAAVLRARGLTFRYPHGDRDAVAAVDLDVAPGEMLALLGPNGSGKSTLLRLLLGALGPDAGDVSLFGRALGEWRREDVAREVGVVTQAEEMAFPLTVRELVAMGRYPHLGAWRREGSADRAAIARALDRCGLTGLVNRSVLELSGGERQRARVARALAQEPRTLLLDEPTASLDIAHEMSLFELLAELRNDGVTIVIVTHNLNIAARYADRLVLLDHGRVAAAGVPDRVLTREIIEAVYHWPVTIGREDGAPQVVPQRRGPQADGQLPGPPDSGVSLPGDSASPESTARE
ncbi:MAG TPA: ABC transporter ATP-binding protein [Longimicrobiales bacterium]|nr:ABC transporter ATP-binding protein [Longimicrobiales bacterium]